MQHASPDAMLHFFCGMLLGQKVSIAKRPSNSYTYLANDTVAWCVVCFSCFPFDVLGLAPGRQGLKATLVVGLNVVPSLLSFGTTLPINMGTRAIAKASLRAEHKTQFCLFDRNCLPNVRSTPGQHWLNSAGEGVAHVD